MKATIQRIRESIPLGTVYRVSCLDYVVTTRLRFTNGEYAILIEAPETKLLKLSKMFEFCPDKQNIKLEVGDDVTSYIPANLFS